MIRRRQVLSRIHALENSALKSGLRSTFFMPNGNQYRGEWVKGTKTGLGAMKYKGKILYEGAWEDDMPHGWGRISEWKEKEWNLVYTGQMIRGKKHGFGYEHASDGSYYEGSFFEGSRNGYGRCWYADHSFYAGDWKDNERHGRGILILPNGNRYEGDWTNGQKHGCGCFYHNASGRKQTGLWENGVSVESTIIDSPHITSDDIPVPSRRMLPEFKLKVECQQSLVK